MSPHLGKEGAKEREGEKKSENIVETLFLYE